MGYKVLVPQPVAQEAIEDLENYGYVVKMGRGAKEEDLIWDVGDCDAILLRTAPCTRAVLEAGKKLKIVARHGAGYNNIDLEAASERGIWVTNTPDATTNSVAEFTLGAIIMAAKRTTLFIEALKRDDFFFKYTNKGSDLIGKTLGIVGLGRIGCAVAKKAYYGLGMRILAYAPTAKEENISDYVKQVSWDELFSQSDFVSLHIPARKENQGCVGEKEFSLMKENAWLINCARGEVVNQKALTMALEKKEIAGAFLDVMESEPFAISDPLFGMNNVVITPHIASNTEECMRLMATQAAGQIHKVLSGQKPDWPVNTPL